MTGQPNEPRDAAADLKVCEAATPMNEYTGIHRYDHGGGRVYREGGGARYLIADFYDEPDREAWILARTALPHWINERNKERDGRTAAEAALAEAKEQLEATRDKLFAVVDELDLSDGALADHGPLGTPPAELVKLVLQQKDRTIHMLRRGFVDVAAPAPAPDDENRRLREALEPSAKTKAAYSGEFTFFITERGELGETHQREMMVPWTTIKEIMAAIRARAALAPAPDTKGEGEADNAQH